jgi:ParB family chromosome partitioning protein
MSLFYSYRGKTKPKGKIQYPKERIDHFFPKNFTDKQKEDLIIQLLESWYKKRQREQER